MPDLTGSKVQPSRGRQSYEIQRPWAEADVH
jgi:hypothetical protein